MATPLAMALTMAAVGTGVETAPAQSTEPDYASWTLEGTSHDYSGTITLPGTFPVGEFTSDSRSPVAVPSGNSTWLAEDTPFGAVYGSSRGKPYINLRPAADNSLSPSTTTYTFDPATPASGWGFALGDIDADYAEISALDEDGNPVPVDGLGFEGVFNYCDSASAPPSCSGADPSEVPTWQPGVTSGILMGNNDAADHTGPSGWFQPTVRLSSLTIRFFQRSGFPVYQTWFAGFEPDPPLPTTTTTTTTSTTTTTTPPPEPEPEPEPPGPPSPGEPPVTPPAMAVVGVPDFVG